MFSIGTVTRVAAALVFSGGLPAQEPAQEKKFFEVKLTKDEVYSYTNLKFKGDFTSFESAAGHIGLGRTEVGVTVVVVIGEGNLQIEAPEAAQEKFKTVMGAHPLQSKFKSVYMRMHPKEFEDAFGKMSFTKAPDDAAFAKVKELYDLKFLASYHAGPLAILPAAKTRLMDFDSVDLGQVVSEEGYWLTLRRYGPYRSVYPPSFVNPKQR